MEHHPTNSGIPSGAWSSPFLNEAQWEVATSPFLAEVSQGRPATPFLDMEEYNDLPAEDELEYFGDGYMGGYEQEAAFSPFILDLRSKAQKRPDSASVSTISRGNPSRRLSEIDAVVLHQMAFNKTNDTNDYLKTVCHYIVLQDGTIGQLWNHEVVLNASNGFNNRSIAIEFTGNFPNDRGKWWYNNNWSRRQRALQQHRPTQPQIQAGRFLLQHLIRTVPSIQFVLAHCQSNRGKPNDPGPDIWYHVAEWAINNAGYNPDGRLVKIKEKGQSIPTSWLQPPTFQPQQAVPQPSPSSSASVQPASTSLKPAYAVERNRYWMNQLGWGKYIYQINDFLLPWVGMSQVSMSEALFAEAVAAWQKANGFSASESDGIIGPKTWNKLKAAAGIAVQEREYQYEGYEFESSDDGFYEPDDAYEQEGTDEDAFESYDDEVYRFDEYEAYTLDSDEEEALYYDFEDEYTEHEAYLLHEGCSCANCQKQEALYEREEDEWTSRNYEQYYFEDEGVGSSLALPIVATVMPTDSRWILLNSADKQHYGIPESVAALRWIGEQWSQKHPNAKIRIGDISQKGGGEIPPHKSHRLGLDVDINLQVDGKIVLVGKESPATGDSRRMIVGSTYVSQHRNYMREFIRTILDNPILPVQVIGYRDPVLIKEFSVIKDWVGHHDHLHVRFCMPKHRSGELAINRVYASKDKPHYTACDVSSVSPPREADGNSNSWSHAVQQNRYWGQQLGWDAKIYEINDFLLPFVGKSNISMGEDLLAEAISVWQRSIGFSGKAVDGILGPKSWAKLKPQLSSPASGSSPAVPTSASVQSLQFAGSTKPPSNISNFRKFRLTTYHVVNQKDFPTSDVRIPIRDERGQTIAYGSPIFFAKLSLNGSAILNDGRLVNVSGKKTEASHVEYGPVLEYHKKAYAKRNSDNAAKGKPPMPTSYSGIHMTGNTITSTMAFHLVKADRLGVGYGSIRGVPHIPFRTLAADLGLKGKSESRWKGKGGLVPAHTRVYIKEYDGLLLPDNTVHDGWFIVNDTGGGIFGAHFDVFVGTADLRKRIKLPEIGHVWFEGIEKRIPPRYSYGLTK